MRRTRVTFDTARELARSLPGVEEGTIYHTPALFVHYVQHPCVLIRLSRTDPEQLRELLQTAWEFVSRPGRRARKASRSVQPLR